MWIYNKKENKVDEQPKQKLEFGDYELFMRLQNLKSYPVSGQPDWKDGQELVEGKDFRIRHPYIQDTLVKAKSKVAVPIPVIKHESEDELWDVVIKTVLTIRYQNEIKQVLQNNFNLTRKNQ